MTDELRELLSLARDREHTPEEEARLHTLLKNDPMALTNYVRWLELDACLTRCFRAAPNVNLATILSHPEASLRPEARVAELPELRAAAVPPSAFLGIATPRAATPVLGFLGKSISVFRRPVVWSILAVATLFYGTFTLISWNLRSGMLRSGKDGNGFGVAMITEASDVKWSTDPRLSAATHGKSVKHGEPLKIDAGLVELQLKQGATLLGEGPAEWTIEGDNQATLKQGKLVARVPEQAVGFTLETPSARILDLGTEFGVEVDQQGNTEVQVIQGEIKLSVADSSHTSTQGASITLRAGDARRIERPATGGPAQVHEVAARADHFTRRIPPSSPRRIMIGGALASSECHFSRSVNYLVNGYGLSGEAHSNEPKCTMWHSALGKVKHEFVLFDLGRACRLSSIKVWNYNEAVLDLYKARGAKAVNLFVSDTGKGSPLSDPAVWRLMKENVELHMADGTDHYNTPDVIELGGVEARFAAIVILDCFADDPRYPGDDGSRCVGLSEVQFYGERVK